jgi:hypothetical protein
MSGIVRARMPDRPQRGLVIKGLAPLALMPAAAFAVHQLRYWLAFGSRAGAQLHAQGHAYLHSVAPWIVLLLAISAGAFLGALGRAFRGYRSLPSYTVSFAGLWLLSAACLVGIYASQELMEGIFATGHPAGLVGVFGLGGWWSVPAAMAVALVLTAVFHGARWTLEEVARRYGAPVPAPVRRVASARFPRTSPVPRLAPLAAGWSGRGPPV